jgi:hypothetical protein
MNNLTIEELKSAKERIVKIIEKEPIIQYDAEQTLKWLDKLIANTLISIATNPTNKQ